ncbi:hypothetical protein BATDEDRAFT_92508 [Batrachochytrium dendrobatidis JAM81]|uniref:Uncharacterized protein n=2 Tax=Batrachochytrium dendrobatidis TaxID=109871 RepID=F4PDS0_BATDJ|nr:uncharacterized protein BATDEDRAFT_92508 [Batrachochytrium dendrobatidis JAM81]EGF76548.1 hypothetical protein BATDEDRAFT_92508 [Batrachochytrium dendrobatidis JAM81]KAJ8324952.1 Ribonuclease H2 subunit C [Batrachochytrium dendrobatidis]KAK5672732.1 Ribonuclease H2 subunit C [Batrachochytrium dendrobatidis]OAJ39114.1 hypothetical protein BDEG_22987 [Batrachochytrium dendrobatidis JEL423]|eukprot:XP_006682908.1 hypothetical protein BATDEDRAFT_92508 [Batrachochytrium dendrobatidis JAM81]
MATLVDGRVLVSGPESAAAVHLLPCRIQHNGPANVTNYFVVNSSDSTQTGTVSSTFRGRGLQGVALTAPCEYSFVVLANTRSPHGTEADHYWRLQNRFKNITVWAHDEHAPTQQSEPLLNLPNWIQLATEIHEPVHVSSEK